MFKHRNSPRAVTARLHHPVESTAGPLPGVRPSSLTHSTSAKPIDPPLPPTPLNTRNA